MNCISLPFRHFSKLFRRDLPRLALRATGHDHHDIHGGISYWSTRARVKPDQWTNLLERWVLTAKSHQIWFRAKTVTFNCLPRYLLKSLRGFTSIFRVDHVESSVLSFSGLQAVLESELLLRPFVADFETLFWLRQSANSLENYRPRGQG